MNQQKFSQQSFVVGLILLLLVGCAAPTTPTPTPIPPKATATAVPPTTAPAETSIPSLEPTATRAPAPATATLASGSGGKIEGTITLNGDLSNPLADVKVILNSDFFGPDAGKEIATTTTDSQGKYSFDNVEPGKYVVGAAVEGQCIILDIASTVTVEVGSVITKDISLPCSP